MSEEGVIKLEYGWGLKAGPVIGQMILLILMLLVSVFTAPDPVGYPDGVWLYIGLMAIMAGLPWLIFIEAQGTRAVLGEDGIRFESWWSGRKSLKWREVQKVYYSSLSQCIVLKGERCRIRLEPLLANSGRFWQILNEQVPGEKIQMD